MSNRSKLSCHSFPRDICAAFLSFSRTFTWACPSDTSDTFYLAQTIHIIDWSISPADNFLFLVSKQYFFSRTGHGTHRCEFHYLIFQSMMAMLHGETENWSCNQTKDIDTAHQRKLFTSAFLFLFSPLQRPPSPGANKHFTPRRTHRAIHIPERIICSVQ